MDFSAIHIHLEFTLVFRSFQRAHVRRASVITEMYFWQAYIDVALLYNDLLHSVVSKTI